MINQINFSAEGRDGVTAAGAMWHLPGSTTGEVAVKLSNKSLYAVRALLYMAYHAPLSTTTVAEIAEKEEISPGFLDQIFQTLRKAELLISQRGPKGGYMLARPMDEITLGQVVRLIEGETRDHFCREMMNRPDGQEETPGLEVAAFFWERVAGEIDAILDGYSLQDLVARGEELGLKRGDFNSFIYII